MYNFMQDSSVDWYHQREMSLYILTLLKLTHVLDHTSGLGYFTLPWTAVARMGI